VHSCIPAFLHGMRELAIADPDGYVMTFAQRVPA
jgi:hypothetical protein